MGTVNMFNKKHDKNENRYIQLNPAKDTCDVR